MLQMNRPDPAAVRPMGDRVLLEVIPWVQSKVLILEPDRSSTIMRGKVVAVGPEVKWVEPGEVVLFSQNGSQPVDDTHRMTTQNSLIAGVDA